MDTHADFGLSLLVEQWNDDWTDLDPSAHMCTPGSMIYRPNRTAINCHRTAQTRRLRSKNMVSKRCHPFLEWWSPTDFLTNGIEAESTQISVDWSFSSRSNRFFFPKFLAAKDLSHARNFKREYPDQRSRCMCTCIRIYIITYIYVEIHIGMEYKLQRPHHDVTGMMANGTTIPLNGKTFHFQWWIITTYPDMCISGVRFHFFFSKFSSLFGRTIPAD